MDRCAPGRASVHWIHELIDRWIAITDSVEHLVAETALSLVTRHGPPEGGCRRHVAGIRC